MTDELFREDATLTECEAHVMAHAEGGVILDRTVFYPQGGGQAGDTGILRDADGREFAVIDTRKSKAHPGGVLHLLAPDAAAPAIAAGASPGATSATAPRASEFRRGARAPERPRPKSAPRSSRPSSPARRRRGNCWPSE